MYLLKHLKPIVPTTEARRLLPIALFEQFLRGVDDYIDELNKTEMYEASNGIEWFFDNMPYVVTERDFHVIASLLSWLGSNCGRCFVQEAFQYEDKLESLEKGFLLSWADWNKRKSWMNNGCTLIEHLLTPPEHLNSHQEITCVANRHVTIHDVEIINYMTLWFATNDGVEYLKKFIKGI